jgi:hypothetical protein
MRGPETRPCERSEAIQHAGMVSLDCFVASLLAKTENAAWYFD